MFPKIKSATERSLEDPKIHTPQPFFSTPVATSAKYAAGHCFDLPNSAPGQIANTFFLLDRLVLEYLNSSLGSLGKSFGKKRSSGG